MFAKRLVAVRLRVRSWSTLDLSYLGRAHVEQQLLATSLYFHASFLLPSDALLSGIVSCLYRFVALPPAWARGPMALALRLVNDGFVCLFVWVLAGGRRSLQLLIILMRATGAS
jgi:hypothetical protein